MNTKMRYLRFVSSHLSRYSRPLSRNNNPIPSVQSSPYTTPAAPEPKPRPPPSAAVSGIADELAGLTLLESMDLTELLRQKLDVGEMPVMAVMMPGMGFPMAGKGGGAAAGGEGPEKKAEEKMVFDVKLEGFEAAWKIKVIKEVRGFTDLGLKEAKDLVEKSPTLLKKGVTKEEAEKIIAKLKEVGAKVSME